MQNKKYFFFLIVGAFILYLLFIGLIFWWHVEIGKDLRDETTAFQQIVENPSFKILVIGDSSAVGVGADDPELSVAGRIGADYPNAEIVNKGKSGMRTAGLVKAINDLESDNYDLILIQIGGNDLIRFVPVMEAKDNMEKVLKRAKQISENVIVLSAGNMETAYIFPKPLRIIYGNRSVHYREELIELTEKYNVHYVDLYREPEDDPFAKEPEKYYARDLFHPSGEGYGVWYERIGPQIRELLHNKNSAT